jgi:division protein CdvB (Snf7/Vps24/ESCRT-III family)
MILLLDLGGDVEKRNKELGFMHVIISPILKIIRKESSPARRALESLLIEIELAINSLSDVLSRLKKRYEDLYTSAVKSVAQRNMAKATIYVNELVEIRKIILRLTISHNFLEQLKVRLGTLNELDKAAPLLISLNKTIEYLKPVVAPIVPGVAVSLDKISSEINSLLGSTAVPTNIMDTEKIRLSSKEAEELMKKIINDAVKTVDTSLPKLIPELSKLISTDLSEEIILPTEIFSTQSDVKKTSEDNKISMSKEADNNIIKDVQKISTANVQRKIDDLENKLLDYIVARGGFLDINDFCKLYGYTREEVSTALDSLVKKGRIKIVNRS